jgi:hypothetical protein
MNTLELVQHLQTIKDVMHQVENMHKKMESSLRNLQRNCQHEYELTGEVTRGSHGLERWRRCKLCGHEYC